ncbi:glycoprotein [hymenopteran chu-related virus 123]|uniref:Glycoprotein n=1 Tax=hymenopteran chu-related virus 123 TaxID=2847797 RepID=A0A7U3NUQ5_9VIRU|nr:glycoprotein [hymenopteran chu-related virus 123]QPB73964.1 glycoprotein [hymenopteran chu-related virus 123]DAZ89732.1 TPA_asm: glycoprotein [Dioxys cincta mononega-like virus]
MRLMVLTLLCVLHIRLGDSSFEPLTPKLRSDIGLLSVNIPPGQIREKYWLHNLIVDLPCIDEAVTPNILVVASEMNMSASAIMKPIVSVNFTQTHKKTEYRIQGPLKTLKMTYNIFKKLIVTVVKRYKLMNTGPATLWGLLDKTRCMNGQVNDVLEDTQKTMNHEEKRIRRDVSKRYEPDKANILNIAGTGHTFNFHQARNDGTTSPLNLSDHFTRHVIPRINTLDRDVIVDRPQLPEGRIFSENIVQDTMTYDQQCGITIADRLSYVTCVLLYPDKERMCYENKLKCHRINTSVREKRGLFDFIGDIQNKLYGVATEKQLKNVHKLINDVHNESLRNSQEIQLIRNNTMTLNNHLVNGLEHLSQNLYHEISKLSHSIQVWANGVDENLYSITAEMQEISMISLIHTATLTLNAYVHILRDMVNALDTLTAHYQDALTSISHHTISARFINDDLLTELWNKISTNTISNLEIAKSPTKQALLTSSIFSTYTTRTKLVIVLRIPLVLKTNDITFWDPRSVPIIKGQYSYEVVMQDNILILNQARKEWAFMDHTDYIICIRELNQICDVDLIWTSWSSPCCHLSVHLSQPESLDTCQIKRAVYDKGDVPFIVASGARSWLISTNRDKMEAQLSCAGYQGVPSHNSIRTLPLLGIVSLPLFCEMRIGNHRIHSPYSQIGASEMLVASAIEEIHYEYQDFIIVNISKEVPFLSSPHHDKFIQPAGADNILFDHDITTIKELNKKMKSDSSLYLDDINRLKSKFEKDEVTYNSSISDLSSYITSFRLWDYLIPTPSVFNIGIVAWMLWLTLRGSGVGHTPAGAALALMSPSHQSFAHPIGNLTTTSNHTPPVTCNVIHTWISWVPIVCLVGMILLHLHMKSLLYVYYTKLSIRLGWTPVNRMYIQHSGENRLNLGILLRFTSLFGQIITRREIVVQAATLPSKQDDWYLTNNSHQYPKAISGSFYRFSKEVRIRVDWNLICLKSRLFTSVDTCQDLPPTLLLYKTDIYSMINKHLPWHWWKCEVESITSIAVAKPLIGDSLYNYLY